MEQGAQSDPRLEPLLAAHRDQPGGLLPLLHAVQHALGCIPETAVPAIARAMNLSRAEVHGVISYYHHFRQVPAGRHVVQVCRAEACQSCGAEQLLQDAQRLLGVRVGETRADQQVTLEPVYCLGLCAVSPAIQVDDRLYGRMNAARLGRLVGELGVVAAAGESAT